jgi:alkylation response protein AidB-like acyl-CoA dehydrogenase
VLSEEQEVLQQVVRAFLADTSPPSAVRRLMESEEGCDPAVWRQMADQMGLPGLAIPDEYGGLGFGWVELGLVFEEMGRALLCSPFLATVGLAAGALLATRDASASADFLPGIAAGETIATLAVVEEAGRWDESGVGLKAVAAAGGWALAGHKTHVLDGMIADLLLVAARTPGGVSLFAVDGQAEGLRRTPLSTMDLTRKQARVEFVGTPARLVGPEGGGWPAVRKGLALGTVALGAEQVGGAGRCLEMALDHAKQREQFGRPVGSFQAIKHKCADLLVHLEAARSAAGYAAWAAAEADEEELLLASSLAKASCSDAYQQVASENIQIHGAIGFTWEHDAHLYFKRAKSSALLFGDPTYHRSLLADCLGI